MKIKSAKFVKSVASEKELIKDGLIEIAFAGKSNVGKSSFINALCSQKKLAKTSSLPGRTRLVNYFIINDSFYFVDLPGYGYAQAGQNNKEMWAQLLENYLIKSEKLKLVLMLVDIRHDPTELDKIMLKFLYRRQIPFKIIATKADKIAKSKVAQYVQNVAKVLGVGKDDIIPVSSENGWGLDKVLDELQAVYDFHNSLELEKLAIEYDAKLFATLLSGEKYDKFFNQITAGIAEKNYDEKLLEQLKDMQIIEVGQDEIMLTDLGEKVLEFRNLTK